MYSTIFSNLAQPDNAFTYIFSSNDSSLSLRNDVYNMPLALKPWLKNADTLAQHLPGLAWLCPSNTSIKREVVAVEAVTVPAGSFENCIKIRQTNLLMPNNTTTYWFRGDIGIIKEEKVDNGVIFNHYIFELKNKNF
jgi:hypothetical protein